MQSKGWSPSSKAKWRLIRVSPGGTSIKSVFTLLKTLRLPHQTSSFVYRVSYLGYSTYWRPVRVLHLFSRRQILETLCYSLSRHPWFAGLWSLHKQPLWWGLSFCLDFTLRVRPPKVSSSLSWSTVLSLIPRFSAFGHRLPSSFSHAKAPIRCSFRFLPLMGDFHRRETAEVAPKRFKVLVNDSSDYTPSLVTLSSKSICTTNRIALTSWLRNISSWNAGATQNQNEQVKPASTSHSIASTPKKPRLIDPEDPQAPNISCWSILGPAEWIADGRPGWIFEQPRHRGSRNGPSAHLS